jgi:5-methylcytosine-specific restriction endonuclease McrA
MRRRTAIEARRKERREQERLRTEVAQERKRRRRAASIVRVREWNRAWQLANAELYRASKKNYAHRRRIATQSDLTGRQIADLLAGRTMCPLCGRKMRSITDVRDSRQKTIDHILPLSVGGKHSLANVRVVCRDCNNRRPKKGTDLTQLPLAV